MQASCAPLHGFSRQSSAKKTRQETRRIKGKGCAHLAHTMFKCSADSEELGALNVLRLRLASPLSLEMQEAHLGSPQTQFSPRFPLPIALITQPPLLCVAVLRCVVAHATCTRLSAVHFPHPRRLWFCYSRLVLCGTASARLVSQVHSSPSFPNKMHENVIAQLDNARQGLWAAYGKNQTRDGRMRMKALAKARAF